MKDRKELTAPCGMDCFNCEIHEKNLTSDVAETLQTKYGWPKEEIACKGCRKQNGKHIHLPQGCSTLECVKSQDVDFCCDCNDFPCSFLAPVADLASIRPHNMKSYNLCRIKKIGLERWIQAEAGQARRKYFTVKFAVGKGQAD